MTRVRIHAEEQVAPYTSFDNGSGPLWCFGSSTIARDGDRVFVSLNQVGEGLAPLCNTRWQLFSREADGWQRVNAAPVFEEREPCPLARPAAGSVLLSANRKLHWCDGTRGVRESYHAEPRLLQFDTSSPGGEPVVHVPGWDGDYFFNEHTYRGVAADSASGEVLLLNIAHYTGHAWSLQDSQGQTTHRGLLKYPERGCYPQVALRGRAAYVIAVSDIVEPNLIWRAYKCGDTGQGWDYDFRMLYFTWTPDITSEPFSPILTFASRDETCGLLRQQDMWVDDEGDVHVVYTDRNVWRLDMRDRFFPDTPITTELKYCRIHHDGPDTGVSERHTLARACEVPAGKSSGDDSEMKFDAPVPTNARLQSTPDGRLHVVYSLSGEGGGMRCQQLFPQMDAEPVDVPVSVPLPSFHSAAERLGNERSRTMDLYGDGGDACAMRYLQLEILPD